MKKTKILMGMPITVEIIGKNPENSINEVFSYFNYIEEKFSVYRKNSEISRINRGEIKKDEYSNDMKTVMTLCEETKKETNGYFDIVTPKGKFDTSGLVKGWSIYNASKIIEKNGFKKFYIEAGGDIQANGKEWKVGIRNPFNHKENVKIIFIRNCGIATSGTYFRGQHVYNPYQKNEEIKDIISLTVIGPNIYESDRFATAAFVMGKKGIIFIENLKGFEGYMIYSNGLATMTTGFEKYTRGP